MIHNARCIGSVRKLSGQPSYTSFLRKKFASCEKNHLTVTDEVENNKNRSKNFGLFVIKKFCVIDVAVVFTCFESTKSQIICI